MDQDRLLAIWHHFNRILDDCKEASSAYERMLKVLLDFNHDSLMTLKHELINDDVADAAKWIESMQLHDKAISIWIDLMKYENSYYGFIAKQCNQYDPENNFWNKNPIQVHPQVLILEGTELIVKDYGSHEELDWILPISYSAFVLTEAISNINMLQSKSSRLLEISIGFVNGDFIGLLPLMRNGNGKLS
jgi:hypothetical protein